MKLPIMFTLLLAMSVSNAAAQSIGNTLSKTFTYIPFGLDSSPESIEIIGKELCAKIRAQSRTIKCDAGALPEEGVCWVELTIRAPEDFKWLTISTKEFPYAEAMTEEEADAYTLTIRQKINGTGGALIDVKKSIYKSLGEPRISRLEFIYVAKAEIQL